VVPILGTVLQYGISITPNIISEKLPKKVLVGCCGTIGRQKLLGAVGGWPTARRKVLWTLRVAAGETLPAARFAYRKA